MSFLNYIEKSFPRVLAVDTEFRFKMYSKFGPPVENTLSALLSLEIVY